MSASGSRRKSAENSGSRRGKGGQKATPAGRAAKPPRKAKPVVGRQRDTLFKPGNIWRFPKGVSGNPGGRPKGLSDAYREWLALPAEENPDLTNAQVIAATQVFLAKYGDGAAAKELRQATEGSRITTWQDDVVALLKTKQVTLDDVAAEFGEELAQELAAAAELSGREGGEAQAPGGQGQPGAESAPADLDAEVPPAAGA